MLIKGMNFRDELIRASRDGNLVVFAGAGVSMNPPSNYPDFEGLTEQIAAGQTLKRGQLDFDRFLGKLEDRGVQVHRLVQEILTNPDSRPNRLHFSLLKMFRTVSAIRLITTNFDTHFSTAAEELFGHALPTCYAPAIPPGVNFSGICYLHGCVTQDNPKLLVLTDRDFGRAYVVDGWAARFLQGIYRQFTVLFVGYRHADPIVFHIARGLPSNISERYYLTLEGTEEDWEPLGIKPISYRGISLGTHAMLTEAVAAWDESVPKPTVWHEDKVKSIVSYGPTADPEKEGYVYQVLRNDKTVHFFTKFASSVSWLEWAERQGLLRPLFSAGELDNVSCVIGDWFVDRFVVDHPEEALSVVARNQGPIHPNLWARIALRLGSRRHQLSVDVLNKWLPVLLRHDSPYYSAECLEHVLGRCTTPEYELAALVLFRYLTKPTMVLKEELDFATFDGTGFTTTPTYEITVRGTAYWLGEAWDKLFKPEPASSYEALREIIVAHFHEAQELLRLTGQEHGDRDGLSSWRQAIEVHEQDRYTRRPIDVLIDAARDLVEWMLEHRPDEAARLRADWAQTDIPTLRRLAIHAMGIDPGRSGDEKLTWLLERGWLYSLSFKHEVFHLIKVAYPNCEESTRDDFLNAVLQGPGQGGLESREADEVYAICELIEWITRADPGCTKAADAFHKAKEYCPGFVAEESPEFTLHVQASWSEENSPVSVTELLAKHPSEILDYLVTFQGDDFRGPTRRALLAKFSQAVAESFDWGIRLAMELKDKNSWKKDLWRSILWGWIAAKLTEDQFTQVLCFIGESNLVQSLGYYMEILLLEKARSTDLESCYLWLPCSERFARQLWAATVKQSETNQREENESGASDDWTFVALNNPGGKTVWSLIHMLSARRREAGDDWGGIPDYYKHFLHQVLIDKSLPAQLGRVFLAWNIPFLMEVDADWTRSSVLPLLDWSKDQTKAEQAWHGFLGMARLPRPLFRELLPLYQGTFSHASARLGRFKDDFLRQIAESCFIDSFDPLQEEWVPNFLSNLDENDRARWAWWVGRFLESSAWRMKERLWQQWISPYWHNRNLGKPAPLSDSEKEEMLKWALELDSLFPDAVQKMLETSVPVIRNQLIYRTFHEKGVTSQFPDQASQLVISILRKTVPPFFACEDVTKLVSQLTEKGTRREDLLAMCDEMTRLGCEQAAELRAALSAKDQ